MSLPCCSYSRVTIENTVEDELLESSIEIRDLDLDVIGRSKVVARNFLAEVSFPIIGQTKECLERHFSGPLVFKICIKISSKSSLDNLPFFYLAWIE